MARKKFTAEQIVVILRQVEIACSQGKSIAESVRASGITEQTPLAQGIRRYEHF